MNKIVETLVNAWATLILGGRRKIEEVPVLYNSQGVEYKLKELVELELAERVLSAI